MATASTGTSTNGTTPTSSSAPASPSTKAVAMPLVPPSTTSSEMPALAQKFREHLVSTVQQSHQLSIDAAQTWMKVVSVIPMMDLPMVPGIAAMPGVEAATKFTFDVAADLLKTQREYALELVSIFVSEKSL